MEISQKYENIWKLLRKYDFDINLDENPDLICVICNGILKNAHQHVCGCRYCCDCIEHYLSDPGNKYCPGKTEDCRDSIMDMKTDIQIDHSTNRAINRINVNCPIAFCTFRGQLKHMENHIDDIHQNKCPFVDFGCTKEINSEEEVIDHLSREYRSHTALLVESVENLRTSLATMKSDSREKDVS